MHEPLRFADLICTRFAHDLSGPLALIAGGLELASEGETAEALAVIAEAAAALRARLRLLRSAWAGMEEPRDAAALAALLNETLIGTRVSVDVTQLEGTYPPGLGRLLLNLALLGVEATAGNGAVAFAGALSCGVRVSIAGPRAAWPAALLSCLQGDAPARHFADARGLLAPLVILLAEAAGCRLTLDDPANGSGPPRLLLTT